MFLSVQSVEHGSDAVALMINDKPGHTFTGWDKSYTNVKANMVIIAQFDIEQVRVNISDEDGTLLVQLMLIMVQLLML